MQHSTIKIRVWCLLGLLLSLYATYVELKTEQDKNYKALCDLSEKVSCTKAFASRFGKGFGLTGLLLGDDSKWNPPNGAIGIFFYMVLLSLTFSKLQYVNLLQLMLCGLSNFISVYLAFLLYFVLDDLCVVCVSIYFVNFFCFLECWKNYRTSWYTMIEKNSKANLNKID